MPKWKPPTGLFAGDEGGLAAAPTPGLAASSLVSPHKRGNASFDGTNADKRMRFHWTGVEICAGYQVDVLSRGVT